VLNLVAPLTKKFKILGVVVCTVVIFVMDAPAMVVYVLQVLIAPFTVTPLFPDYRTQPVKLTDPVLVLVVFLVLLCGSTASYTNDMATALNRCPFHPLPPSGSFFSSNHVWLSTLIPAIQVARGYRYKNLSAVATGFLSKLAHYSSLIG